MYIKKDMDFNDLKENCWSGAVDTLRTVEENGKEEDLMQYIEEAFDDCPELTSVNDLLWFDSESIFEALGISEEEEEEDEEEEIDIDFAFYNGFDSFCEDFMCKDCPLFHPTRDCEEEFNRLKNA